MFSCGVVLRAVDGVELGVRRGKGGKRRPSGEARLYYPLGAVREGGRGVGMAGRGSGRAGVRQKLERPCRFLSRALAL